MPPSTALLKSTFDAAISKYGVKYKRLPFPYNPAYNVALFKKLDLKKDYLDSSKLDIIDAYAGLNGFTMGLQEYLKPRKHVLMTEVSTHHKFWQELLDQKLPCTENMELLKEDSYKWETYTDLEEKKLISPEIQPRDKVNSTLLFHACLTHDEGFLVQMLTCMQNQNWIFKYGSTRLLLWVKSSTASKLLAEIGSRKRRTITIQREAYSNSRLIGAPDTPEMRELFEHLDPFFYKLEGDLKSSGRNPLKWEPCLVELTPRKDLPDIIDMQEFDYVIGKLNMMASTNLSNSVALLGAGAKEYFQDKLSPEVLKLTSSELPLEEYVKITEEFHYWPFKPDLRYEFAEKSLDDFYS